MNVPADLTNLLQQMAVDLPATLCGNLVGIYLWGSLTYDAFDETCSDVDLVAVTARDLDDREFSDIDDWFKRNGNRWAASITTLKNSPGMDRTETRSSGSILPSPASRCGAKMPG